MFLLVPTTILIDRISMRSLALRSLAAHSCAAISYYLLS
jgi:hypothetical protein